MPQFVMRPTVIHAQQILPGALFEAWLQPYLESGELRKPPSSFLSFEMSTSRGLVTATTSDWLVQQADGELDAMTDAAFRAAYEPVEVYEQAAIELPRIGSIWRHTSGALYVVMMHTNDEGDDPAKREKYPTTIAYVNVRNGKRHSRRADDWHRSFTPEPLS